MGGIFKSPSPPVYVAETADTSEEDTEAKQDEKVLLGWRRLLV